MNARYSPNDVEFVAEDVEVWILPRIKMPALPLLSHAPVGPFKVGIPLQVPLWLAVALKKKKHCQVQCPEWMQADNLASQVTSERADEMLAAIHPHYVDIASILLAHAADDIPDIDRVRSLVVDIENVRQQKLRNGFRALVDDVKNHTVHQVKLVNLSMLEANNTRALVLPGLTSLRRLAPQKLPKDAAGSSGLLFMQDNDQEEYPVRKLRR